MYSGGPAVKNTVPDGGCSITALSSLIPGGSFACDSYYNRYVQVQTADTARLLSEAVGGGAVFARARDAVGDAQESFASLGDVRRRKVTRATTPAAVAPTRGRWPARWRAWLSCSPLRFLPSTTAGSGAATLRAPALAPGTNGRARRTSTPRSRRRRGSGRWPAARPQLRVRRARSFHIIRTLCSRLARSAMNNVWMFVQPPQRAMAVPPRGLAWCTSRWARRPRPSQAQGHGLKVSAVPHCW